MASGNLRSGDKDPPPYRVHVNNHRCVSSFAVLTFGYFMRAGIKLVMKSATFIKTEVGCVF